MKEEDRLKLYVGMVDVSRKWVSVMDTKAGFLSALNALLLGFMWTGAKLVDAGGLPRGMALLASIFSIASLFSALLTVMPRGSLSKIFGSSSRYKDGFKAISFYGYVVEHYPKGQEARFIADVEAMDATSLGREALEQHFTISHGLQIKSDWVNRAGWLLMVALFFAGVALVAKVFS
jgi:hypothetical protein